MSAPTPPPEAGEILAEKYVVERVLGQGGMGVVVAARHKELDARVAIKLLRTRPAPSVEAVERFQREARSAARLKSDHVAKVSDVGVLSDGTPYMVLEHLEGADLAELVRGGPLAPGLTAELVAQACEAIAEAHAQGIVHRDLKPSNLFVTRTVRGSARVKVLDFGISKLRTGGADAMAETAEGAILGTPLYMSPEQMRSSRDVDARTDVWSLGMVAYELLTGKVPWSTASLAALALDVTTTTPPDPTSLRSEIPPELGAIVLRCLEKDPAARYASADELAAMLAPFREPPSPGATDALLGRVAPLRGAIEVAATTPAQETPIPKTPVPVTPPVAATRAAPKGEGSGSWAPVAIGAVALGALAVGLMYAGDLLSPAEPPSVVSAPVAPAPRTSDEDTGEDAAGESATPPDTHAGPAIEADLHPRPCLAPTLPSCANATEAWCHPEGTRVACCGPGLVPTNDGLCECPPGGATDPAAIASGCPPGETDPEALALLVRTRVREALRGHLPAFRTCYEAALTPGAAVSGEVTFGFAISPWGELWDPRLDGSTLPNVEAQRCILAELRTLRLDPPLPGAGPLMVRYPIQLAAHE